jgi:hypothetical protein
MAVMKIWLSFRKLYKKAIFDTIFSTFTSAINGRTVGGGSAQAGACSCAGGGWIG